MAKLYYSEYAIENIARRVLTAYDARLYYGQPSAISIKDLIEANGLSLEYQYLRKNGRILGKTIFDDGLEAVYDMERRKYTLFPVRAGTILVDASLCEEDASTGRFRFTCAHELALMPAAKEARLKHCDLSTIPKSPANKNQERKRKIFLFHSQCGYCVPPLSSWFCTASLHPGRPIS